MLQIVSTYLYFEKCFRRIINCRIFIVFSRKESFNNKSADKMDSHHTNPVFVPDDGVMESPTSRRDVFKIDLKDAKQKEDEALENYDPYVHRKVEHPTTNADTLFHLLKGCLGTGILAMPKAFSHSGYIIGSFGTIIIGIICTYSIHLLIKSQYELSKRRKCPSLTYPATAEAAFSDGPKFARKFAPYSVHFVNAFVLLYQLGTCSVYVVFIAANIQNVANNYITELGIEMYMLMILVPLILLNWIRNLKLMAPLSTLANAITLVSFGMILYYLVRDGPTFRDKEPVAKLENIPLFVGTVLFALEAIGVILPLENEMKTPKAFGKPAGVLNIAMSSIIVLYFGMGLLGYMTYGDLTEGSITLNLPKDEILAQIVKISLAVAIFVTYGLQCYVAVDITWNEYIGPKLEKNSRQLIWEYVVRTCLVIITFMFAAAVPKLDLFISLIGAFCLSAVGITFPAIIDTCTYWHTKTGFSFYLMLIKNSALVLFGVLGLIAGTYTSLRDIVREFS